MASGSLGPLSYHGHVLSFCGRMGAVGGIRGRGAKRILMTAKEREIETSL